MKASAFALGVQCYIFQHYYLQCLHAVHHLHTTTELKYTVSNTIKSEIEAAVNSK